MKLEERYTAAQLAGTAMACAGAAWVVISLVELPLRRWLAVRLSGRVGFGAELGIALVALVAVVGMFLALGAFTRGVQQDLWDEAALAKVKAQVDRSRWSVLMWVMALSAWGFFLFQAIADRRGHSMGAGLLYFWMSPLIALGQLRRALRPPTQGGGSIWSGGVKPLVSEHWGHGKESDF